MLIYTIIGIFVVLIISIGNTYDPYKMFRSVENYKKCKCDFPNSYVLVIILTISVVVLIWPIGLIMFWFGDRK